MTIPLWLQTLQASSDNPTKNFALLLGDPRYKETFDQITRSPTLQQDIIEYVSGTGRFAGQAPGKFTTDGIQGLAAQYDPNINTVQIGTARLLDTPSQKMLDAAQIIEHEIQHAYTKAGINGLPVTPDPSFIGAPSPERIWNHLLDEAEAQMRQYRVAKEIYDIEKAAYDANNTLPMPRLFVGDSGFPNNGAINERALLIQQWLDTGASPYQDRFTPSAEPKLLQQNPLGVWAAEEFLLPQSSV